MPCSPAVIDASSIIQIKHDIPAASQWEVLKLMEEHVEAGNLVFPREVAREVKGVAHPDAPGVWVHGVEKKNVHPIDPADETMQQVLAVAGAVVDPDVAVNGDAQVLTMARELELAGHHPRIVSEDVIDSPPKMSVLSACQLLAIPHIALADYLSEIGYGS